MFLKDLRDFLHKSLLDVEKGTGHEGTLSQVATLEHEPLLSQLGLFPLHSASHMENGSPSLQAHVTMETSGGLPCPASPKAPTFT